MQLERLVANRDVRHIGEIEESRIVAETERITTVLHPDAGADAHIETVESPVAERIGLFRSGLHLAGETDAHTQTQIRNQRDVFRQTETPVDQCRRLEIVGVELHRTVADRGAVAGDTQPRFEIERQGVHQALFIGESHQRTDYGVGRSAHAARFEGHVGDVHADTHAEDVIGMCRRTEYDGRQHRKEKEFFHKIWIKLGIRDKFAPSNIRIFRNPAFYSGRFTAVLESIL